MIRPDRKPYVPETRPPKPVTEEHNNDAPSDDREHAQRTDVRKRNLARMKGDTATVKQRDTRLERRKKA